MSPLVAFLPLLLQITDQSTTQLADAPTECISVWIEDENRPVQCDLVPIWQGVKHHSKLCLATDADTASLRVRFVDCMQGPRAAISGPAAAVIDHVVEALVTEGKASKTLVGRSTDSWEGAAAALATEIAAWHARHSPS